MEELKKNIFEISLYLICFLIFSSQSKADIKEYQIDVDYYAMNQTGKTIEALSFSHQIPGPVIEATVGDTLRVTVNNKLKEPTSIHWHGVLLPNDQDGVPYLTTPPIKPGTQFTFEYEITHPGTYWYHSHSGLQEQRGLYGALVFYPKTYQVSQAEKTLVFSDWTDEHPNRVLANLKKSDDFYALKKDAVQSWDKVFKYGSEAIKNRLQASWTRMGPMDLSDIGYDAFLVNGQQEEAIKTKQQTVKLRLINAAASTYFKIHYAGGDFTVVAADGVDVIPFQTNELTIAIAETYDIIVHASDDHSYELRASAEDGTGYSSTFIGQGEKIFARKYIAPNVFLMGHAHDQHHGSKTHHQMAEHSSNFNSYDNLRATFDTRIDERKPLRVVKLNLTGFMDGFQWSFDDIPFSKSDKILVKRGERVRFILTNETMMHHPIHLHGHFFRVLNKHGEYSPLKHTVNIPAMGQQTIEFDANEEKDWFFHCHNLYHMKSGMSRIVSYGESPIIEPDLLRNIAKDNNVFFRIEQAILTQMLAGEYDLFNNKHKIGIEFDWDWDDAYDIEAYYAYRFTRFFSGFFGGEFEKEEGESEQIALLGIRYMLPLLIVSEFRVDSEGDIRIQVGSALQFTKRFSFEWFINTDKEYRIGLFYEVLKSKKVALVYDDLHKIGIGFKLEF